MAYITTEVYVELVDFEDIELIEALKDRGYYVSESSSGFTSVQSLYDAWVYKTGNFEDLFRQFCQENINRSF